MLSSIKKNKKGISLMLFSSFCVCIGQLFWKLSTNENLLYLIIGFAFYGFGAMIMLYAYKFGSLSVLQPMLSANYIFTIILATAVLGEPMSLIKVIGIIIIMIGVVLVGGGDDD